MWDNLAHLQVDNDLIINEMNKKRQILVTLCLALASVFSAQAQSGDFGVGNALHWEFADGTLTISGNGEIDITVPPWYDLINDITEVVVEDGITRIGNATFSGYSNVTTATIGSGVVVIGRVAFAECYKLKTVYFNAVNCRDFIDTNEHFRGCQALTNVVFGDKVERIPVLLFYGASTLKNITMSSSITDIGVSAFYNCAGLASLEIGSGVIGIGANAFNGCVSLTELNIPDNVTTLGNAAFINCTGLKSLSIGKGLTTIPDYAFSNSGLTTLIIPETVVEMRTGAFSSKTLETIYFNVISCKDFSTDYPDLHPFINCLSLKTVIFGDNVQRIPEGAFMNKTLSSLKIGSKVTSIGWKAFYSCPHLTEIDIPDNVLTIGNAAFTYCSAVTSITIGSGVSAIPNDAFLGTSITTLTIPEGISSIATGAFSGSSKLETIYFNAINCSSFFDLSGHFGNCPLLNTVVFGDRVQQIPSHVLSGTAVENVTIGSSVVTIGDAAFAYSRLKSVDIPDGVTTIGNAFTNCTQLTSATIGSGVTAIPSSAFSGSGLTEITIPENITSIGRSAFNNCGKLKTIYFNARNCSNFFDLSGHFANCGALTTLVIGDNVRNIPDFAFSSTNLETVTIGSGVRTIGGAAFAWCNSLETIVNKATIPQAIDAIVFTGVDKRYVTLFVPETSLTDYKAANVWKDFQMKGITSIKNISVSSGIQVYPNPTIDIVNIEEQAEIKVYSLQGALLQKTFGTQVDLSSYPRGVYQLQVNREIIKVIKK